MKNLTVKRTVQSSMFSLCLMMFLMGISEDNAAAQTKEEDVILNAMQDEIKRNMAELKLPEYEKPFYILYSVMDFKLYNISASLGALNGSQYYRGLSSDNMRLIVGDYEFNDESFDDSGDGGGREALNSVPMPTEPDYFGVRRALWSETEAVYRRAAKNYAKHQETLKETGKPIAEVPHRSFAKTEPVHLVRTASHYQFNSKLWEGKLRRLSAIGLKHPDVEDLDIVLEFNEGYDYTSTSEGTVVRVPQRSAFLSIKLVRKKEKKSKMKIINHRGDTPDELPSEEALMKEIEALFVDQPEPDSTFRLEEDYKGPVLVSGAAVASAFDETFFSQRSALVASHVIPDPKGHGYRSPEGPMEDKIGKSIVSTGITMHARPKLKTYNGVTLKGSFDVDDEGVIPPDDLLLIENGILRNLMNGRTVSHKAHTVHGFGSGVGVIEVSFTQKFNEKILKEKLLQRAREEGLEFAIIIRESEGASEDPDKVYKVYVTDGREELLTDARLDRLSLKSFKRILGASDKVSVRNFGNGRSTRFPGNGFTSFIVPESMLFEEVEVVNLGRYGLREDGDDKKEYVPSPLKKTK